MKIKFFIPALLLCFFIFPSKSYAFENVDTTYQARSIRANMFSSYSNNEFHIPPHSDDSTHLLFYYPLERHREFGFELGRIDFHFTSIPALNVNQNSGSLISFVYTYDLSLVVSGKEYTLSGNNKYTSSPNTIYPYWQSAVIDDWHGEAFLKFDVHLTYTNMDSESVLASFNLDVPEFTASYRSMDYYNPVYYLKNIGNSLTEGIDQILHGFDPVQGDSINSQFNDTVADLDSAEDNLFELASNDINYQTYEDFFALTSVEGAIAFVSSWMQSIYTSLGVFGMPILIGLVLLVVTRIIGYQNFSAGGG